MKYYLDPDTMAGAILCVIIALLVILFHVLS